MGDKFGAKLDAALEEHERVQKLREQARDKSQADLEQFTSDFIAARDGLFTSAFEKMADQLRTRGYEARYTILDEFPKRAGGATPPSSITFTFSTPGSVSANFLKIYADIHRRAVMIDETSNQIGHGGSQTTGPYPISKVTAEFLEQRIVKLFTKSIA